MKTENRSTEITRKRYNRVAPLHYLMEYVIKSGLEIEQVTDLAAGIFKLIEARGKVISP